MVTGISRGQEEQLASNYALVKDAIDRSCEKIQKDPQEITLVAVSKSVGPEIIAHACDLGIRVFGENRPQVLKQKAEWIDAHRPDLVSKIDWHMIGHLQRNKAKQTLEFSSLIHSVDSHRLAVKLSEIGVDKGVEAAVLAQVKISEDESKFGVDLHTASSFVKEITELPGIRVMGLMGMASFVNDEKIIRKEFSRLKRLYDQSRYLFDGSGFLSMGMSSDYEWAIEEGATHVRVGSSLFRL